MHLDCAGSSRWYRRECQADGCMHLLRACKWQQGLICSSIRCTFNMWAKRVDFSIHLGDLPTTKQSSQSRVQGAARSIAAGVTEAHGRMHLLRASTWRRHGCASLAVTEACTFLASYSNDPEDTLHAYSQLALVTLDRHGAHYCHFLVYKWNKKPFQSLHYRKT